LSYERTAHVEDERDGIEKGGKI